MARTCGISVFTLILVFVGLEGLPMELQRNFNLMRDLDTRSQEILKEIDNKADRYMKEVRNYPPAKRSDYISSIQKLFSKSKEYGDDKVQLAMQTYEMVDKHIRKLDSDLARFEAELKDKSRCSPKQAPSRERTSEKKKKREKDRELEDEIPKKKKRKQQKDQDEEDQTPVVHALPLLSIANSSDVLDMPVDPNEPTYCLCHQVSYGEMIGCDNPDCPIEWFHFACVGLSTKPKGKWYCPRCTADRKKKQ
ncbi:hypothetical protein LSH36_23g07028 [Paralvinella palmiformis]|uniref:Inhibitor of growth protein n=1 Tax=Paralvinella palmiformis TaxID=53620 RepID=A0AAD9KB48_9ANNE|nr:hypothetical protein LSH36_23g07028 [Paralvinella palmiformis]